MSNSSLSSEPDIYHDEIEIDYDGLYNPDVLVNTIQIHFKAIALETDLIELNEEQQEIEIDLALAFF